MNPIIAKTEFGKPYCPDLPRLHFNISHSGDYQAIAFAPFPIGIDIERLSRFERLPNLEKFVLRFYHKSESEHILSLPSNEQPLETLKIWTRKESYVKCDGRGFRIPMNSFNTFECGDFRELFFDGDALCTLCIAVEKGSIDTKRNS